MPLASQAHGRFVPDPVAFDFFIGLNAADIQALPASGVGYTNTLAKANATITPSSSDIGSVEGNKAFAAGLIYNYKLTNDPSNAATYRNKVITALDTISDPTTGWLSVNNLDHQIPNRMVCGWVLAADLIGYHSANMLTFADQIRDKTVTGSVAGWNTMRKCAYSFAGNHGTLAKASFMACCLYRGEGLPSWVLPSLYCYWGDTSRGFGTKAVQNTDTTGQNAYSADGATAVSAEQTWGLNYTDNGWTPLNSVPGDATKDQALITEVSRETSNAFVNYSVDGSGHPNWGDDYVGTSAGAGASYFFTSMEGIFPAMLMAEANGDSTIWTTGTNNGPLRAWQYVWAYKDKWPSPTNVWRFALSKWQDSLMEQKYPGQLNRAGVAVAAAATGYGFGFTDWLQI